MQKETSVKPSVPISISSFYIYILIGFRLEQLWMFCISAKIRAVECDIAEWVDMIDCVSDRVNCGNFRAVFRKLPKSTSGVRVTECKQICSQLYLLECSWILIFCTLICFCRHFRQCFLVIRQRQRGAATIKSPSRLATHEHLFSILLSWLCALQQLLCTHCFDLLNFHAVHLGLFCFWMRYYWNTTKSRLRSELSEDMGLNFNAVIGIVSGNWFSGNTDGDQNQFGFDLSFFKSFCFEQNESELESWISTVFLCGIQLVVSFCVAIFAVGSMRLFRTL